MDLEERQAGQLSAQRGVGSFKGSLTPALMITHLSLGRGGHWRVLSRCVDDGASVKRAYEGDVRYGSKAKMRKAQKPGLE